MFKIGDRVSVVRVDYATPVNIIGATGTVAAIVDGHGECLWVTPDTLIEGMGNSKGDWAMLDTEVELLED